MKKLAFSMLLLATPALAAVPAPKPSITNLEQLPVLTMQPYNEAANADAQVADAFARAQKSHKRVLIDLGGNWCGDCIILANFVKLPEMRRFMCRWMSAASTATCKFPHASVSPKDWKAFPLC
jgi:hypothetical protein